MEVESVVRAVFEEAWNAQRFDNVEGALAESFSLHLGGASRLTTVDELKAIVAGWHEGFPDFRFDVHAVVASGGRAAVHATLYGTHRGRWNGLEATGRSITVEHMFFFRLENDQIVEVWELLERVELRRQLTGR